MNNTKKARKEAENKRDIYKRNYLDRIKMLFNNSVNIENLPDTLPKRYLLRCLFEYGGIAYDKETDLFLRYVPSGQLDIYGLPTAYQLFGYTGRTLMRKADEVVILRANDYTTPLIEYVEQQINKIVDIDLSIEQNLDACKTMTIAECQDQSTLLSLVNINESRRLGATVAFVNRGSNIDNKLTVTSTGASYLVDKLIEARKEIYNETLSALGICTANTDKRERVQGVEVRTSNSYALNSLNILIDTFNYDSEYGGLSIRLHSNLKTEMEDNNDTLYSEYDNGQQNTDRKD